MSTLKVNNIQDATGNDAISIDSSGNVTLAAGFVPQTAMGRRNLIINGAMQVSQRGTSFTGASTGYTLDKWRFEKTATDQLVADITQVSDAPDGFHSSLKYTTTTTETTLDADDYVNFQQRFEGQDLVSLGMNTSGAKQFTVSFWVKSSVTGTYGVWFYVADSNANIGSTYTVDAANTWEYKTVTFTANTSSGTCNYDNTLGGLVSFTLAAGSNYTSADNTSWNTTTGNTIKGYGHTAALITTASSTWQITGVQLEVGSVATPFEHRSYGEELALCQRYFYAEDNGDPYHVVACGAAASSTTFIGTMATPVTMRAAPTLTTTGAYELAGALGGTATGIVIIDPTTSNNMQIRASGSMTTGHGGILRNSNDASATFHLDAEL